MTSRSPQPDQDSPSGQTPLMRVPTSADRPQLRTNSPITCSPRLLMGRIRAAYCSGLWGLAVLVPASSATPQTEAAPTIEPQHLESFEWRELGPSVFSGRIVDIELVPSEPGTILVAGASGGLFRTINNGTTWECIFQNEGTISIGDIAVDPNDSNVIWVGSGESNNQRSSYWGDGIYKSTDGGVTWKNTGLGDTHHIGRILIDPRDSDTVYVAALGHLYTANEERGLYKTVDGGDTWTRVLAIDADVGVVDVVIDSRQPDTLYAASYERRRRAWNFDGAGPGSAIHKSTNGGHTWERLTGGLPDGNIGRIGLSLYGGKPGILYATVSNQNDVPVPEPDPEDGNRNPGFRGKFEKGHYTLQEVSADSSAAEAGLRKGDVLLSLGGQDIDNFWAYLRALGNHREGDKVDLVLMRDGERLEVSLELQAVAAAKEDKQPARPRQVGGEIYRSTDGGTTWEKRNEKAVGGSPAYYYGQIRVDPGDSDRLYVLGVSVKTSADGGESWESGNLAGSVHVDNHAFVVDPKNSKHLLLGNDGGLAVSYDGGKEWDHFNNLPLAQFYAVGVDMSVPYKIYGGTQDNGTWGGPSRSRNPRGIAQSEWRKVGGGDGFYAQIDPSNPDIVYGESQFGALYRFDRTSWRRSSIRPPRTDPDGERDRFNWSSPILISHHNAAIIYFGGNRLFKSFNRGEDWPVVSSDLTTADESKIAGNVPHCTITSIAESPLDPNLLMVGTDDGLVQISSDGGLSWTNLAGRFPEAPSNWWVSRVQLSRHVKERAFVAFTGYREDDFRAFVYMSSNSGQSWSLISGGLPERPVNVVHEDPVHDSLIYVGTDAGVHASLDLGRAWFPLDGGMPTVPVHDLVVHSREGELVAATHGRGFWAVGVGPLQELNAEILDKDVHLFDVPDVQLLGSRSSSGWSGDRSWYGQNPESGAHLHIYLRAEVSKEDTSLSIVDLAGETLRELDAPLTPGLHRVTWDLRRKRGSEGGRRRRSSVGAGNYTAVLRVGEEEFRAAFRILADPIEVKISADAIR